LAYVYEIQFQSRPEKYISALIVRQLWKLSRPSEQHLHWSSSAKKGWMISLPSIRWGCTGSLDILEYQVMRSLSSQGMALL
jgi:hypothetical protein